jgi:hypothetical protein
MGRCRVVRPQEIQLSLSDGDWIRVKKRLTAGEAREQFARIVKDAPGGERPTLASMQVGISRILAYLLDWSLTDEKGMVLPLRNGRGELAVDVMTASLNSIDPDSFSEILSAVEAHEEAMEKEREVEKNSQATASNSSAISTSVAG